jgi:hypothetical protein
MSFAQPICYDAVTTHERLQKEYGEIPFVEMNEKNVRRLIMYVNMQTGTWSVFVYEEQEKQLCIITSGRDFKPAENLFDTKL